MLLKLALTPPKAPSLREIPVKLDALIRAMSVPEDSRRVWMDLQTGELGEGDLDDEDAPRMSSPAPVPGARVQVEPVSTRTRWGDISDFVEELPEGDAKTALGESIHGKGVFRRFKEMLSEFPDEQREWNAFSDRRQRERALAWLREQGLKPAA